MPVGMILNRNLRGFMSVKMHRQDQDFLVLIFVLFCVFFSFAAQELNKSRVNNVFVCLHKHIQKLNNIEI